MRIVLLTSVPRTIEAFFLPWIQKWVADEITVVTASGPADDPFGYTPDFIVEGLGQRPRVANVATAHRLNRWISSQDADCVLTSTATASALCRLYRPPTPVVYFCHGLHWSSDVTAGGLVARAIESASLRHTAACITMNEFDRRWFASRGHELPLLHLDAGVGLDLGDWPVLPERSQPSGAPIRLLWVGEFSARKRPFDALDVLSSLLARGIACRLTMLGTGPLHPSVVRSVTERRLPVELPGFGSTLDCLEQADAILHTASWEGLCRVLLEGVATGTPCFGYSVKGVRDCPGVDARGRPGDTEGLADAVSAWVSRGMPRVNVDRDVLSWQRAHARVTEFLQSRPWNGR